MKINEMEGIQKEAVVASFEVGLLSWHLPGGTEGNHEKLQSR
jgi:hypothetical protein